MQIDAQRVAAGVALEVLGAKDAYVSIVDHGADGGVNTGLKLIPEGAESATDGTV